MIRYDELSFAEKMHDKQSFAKGYCIAELNIYAKWLKYNYLKKIGKTYDDPLTPDELSHLEEDVKRDLVAFCEIAHRTFNYVCDFREINKAISSTRLHKLKLPEPLPITKNEWNVIMGVEDENLRRILFVMLVDSKYFRYFNSSLVNKVEITQETVFYVQAEDDEIIKMSKAKFESKSEASYSFHKLGKLGLIDLSRGKYKSYFLKFVDIDPNSELIGYVTDYDHLDLQYDLFAGDKSISVCKQCGHLFKQGKMNNGSYCYKHRGYQKIGLRFVTCVDCGKEFSVSANNRKKIRCDVCQKEYIKAYDRARKSKK